MNILSNSLQKNLTEIKKRLPSEDILTYTFETADKTPCAIIYADGIVNKELLGDLIARPLSKLDLQGKNPSKSENEGGRYALKLEIIQKSALFPELKEQKKIEDVCKEVLDGNSLLLVDDIDVGLIVGAKFIPVRAVMEPPTDVTIKGPREGFIEDVKTNMALIRKRLKTPKLQFESMRVGKNSDTIVTLCWLEGTSKEGIKEEIKEKLKTLQIDFIPDSSYIAAFLSPRKHTIFHTIGTTEKPDVFAAKLSEGRVGVLVDGSPIALTAPYLLMEDLQSSEDYFISPFMATLFRALRVIALLIALLLPAFYVSAQLYKLQLLPLGLTLTIASSIRELPLSPNLEMFVVLFLLETLKEASIRMPKYVGMSLSVVGALVLGETAVSAGFLSTPAIIVVALSGICLYTVPDFVETGSLLRWLFLLVAGSIGPFGIVLTAAFLLCYLVSADAFGAPALAPFSPLNRKDLRDSIVKYDTFHLTKRPRVFRLKNKTRLAINEVKKEKKTE
ncbi:MAG: spore germination protein [Clostridia bacterium]|nr:spore germination protein [Clostridia bacterium]